MARPRTRGNGEGSVWPVPGRKRPWAAAVVVAWSPEGRPIRRVRYASSEREAKALLADMVSANTTSRPMPDDRLTVGKWLNLWLRRQGERDDLRPNTVAVYDRSVRLLLPELGRVPLRRLRSSQVTSALAALGRSGYTAHTVAGARSVLSTSIKDAQREGHVLTNEAALAKAPKVKRQGLPAPDTATVRALLAELAGHRLAALYVLLAGTGLRIGEATGLRWEDITLGDLPALRPSNLSEPPGGAEPRGRGVPPVAAANDEGMRPSVAVQGRSGVPVDGPPGVAMRGLRDGTASLTVTYQLQRINGEHVLTDPKTDTAGRVVFLPPSVVEALGKHRARQAKERLKAGRDWRQADLVFTTAEGQPVAETTAHWVLSAACKRAGVRHVSPHDLRRFALTKVEERLGREAAQRLGGHADPSMTERYISTTNYMLAQVAAVLEEAIGQ